MKITIQGKTVTTFDGSLTMHETATITTNDNIVEYAWEELTASVLYAVEKTIRTIPTIDSTNERKKTKSC